MVDWVEFYSGKVSSRTLTWSLWSGPELQSSMHRDAGMSGGTQCPVSLPTFVFVVKNRGNPHRAWVSFTYMKIEKDI